MGGRVRSLPGVFPARTIELGGELIDYSHTTILGYVKRSGLTRVDLFDTAEDVLYRIDGATLPESRIIDGFRDVVLRMKEDVRSVTSDISVRNFDPAPGSADVRRSPRSEATVPPTRAIRPCRTCRSCSRRRPRRPAPTQPRPSWSTSASGSVGASCRASTLTARASSAATTGSSRERRAAAIPLLNGELFARAHWPSDPNALGSYTCNQPGYFTTMEGWLGEQAGNLAFAGEHTDSFHNFQGFIEGAAQSGTRATEYLLERIRKGQL